MGFSFFIFIHIVLVKKLDRDTKGYIEAAKTNAANGKAPVEDERLTKIKEYFAKAIQLSDQKMQLASQTYELVDQKIQKLDKDLKKFQEEFHDVVIKKEYEKKYEKKK